MKIFCIFCSGPRIQTWTKQLLSWGYEPPRFTITLIRNVIGCEGLDLNQRPLAYETSELPDCSTPQCYWLRRVGFEPTTSGLWDQRATRLLHPTMFGYDGRTRTSISYWTTFMKNNLPLPPFDIISWRKYTTSLSHHSIHLSVMFVNIKQDSKESNQIISLSFYCCGVNL